MSPFLTGFLGGLLGAIVLVLGSGLIVAHRNAAQARARGATLLALMRQSEARARGEAANLRELREAEERARGN